jgi:hypothetical protein
MFFNTCCTNTRRWTVEQRFSTWGTRTPRGTWGGYRGYANSPQGYAKFKKPHPNEAYLGRIFYFGVREGDGGTQRGTILIWGYSSTKRLRTPGLTHIMCNAFKNIFFCRNPNFDLVSSFNQWDSPEHCSHLKTV